MFDRLIASNSRGAERPAVPSGTVSLLVHAGVCAAAVLATLRPDRVAGGEGQPIVISWPEPMDGRSHDLDPFDPVPGPVGPIDLPTQSPIGLPPIDARQPFDVALLQRAAHAPSGRGSSAMPGEPWSADAVDEPPVLLAGPPLAYPEGLRRTGTTGTVMAQLVIDTLGRAERGTLLLQSSPPGFETAARAYVLGALFRPGRTHGRAVRVLVRLPISFMLRPSSWRNGDPSPGCHRFV